MVDWASDVTAVFGDHGEACLSLCQSFLTTKRLSDHMSFVEFRRIVTILHLTLLDVIHLN